MTIILGVCVIAAAAWLVLSLVQRTGADPADSVRGFSRALAALEPQRVPARPVSARSARRPPRTR
jgi:hypothetical protein